jgi:hypothetical protein
MDLDSHAIRRRRTAALLVPLALAFCAACGDGGGGGGSGSLDVSQEVTYLLNDGGTDPRTGHKIEFYLRDLKDPGTPLTEDDIEVRLDGTVDVEARVRVNPPDVAKKELALVLDVSSSLTADDLRKLKASAQKLATEILPLIGRLRIYYFSSPSRTQLLGEYVVTDNGLGGLVWSPDPVPDIDGIPSGDDSTALFHAVRKAILEDSGDTDIFVVFSDGKENSSPQGAREEALDLIESLPVVVFSLGFGRVDRSELQALSVNGKFLGVKPSLDGLFDEVGRQIESIYTVVYDTPTAFGTHKLDLRIKVEGSKVRYNAQIPAGVDLAKAAWGRYPSLPGSVVELSDLTQSPPVTITYTVLSIEDAKPGAEGLFAFAIDAPDRCPQEEDDDCEPVYQGPYGAGSRALGNDDEGVYFPAQLSVGEEWTDVVSGEKFTFVGFENVEVLRGTGNRRRYRCAKVTFPGGTHWFALEIGLVRTRNSAGNIVRELASVPCLSSGFDGGCTVR